MQFPYNNTTYSQTIGNYSVQAPLRFLLVEDSVLDADVLTRFLRYHDIEHTYERVDTVPALNEVLKQSWDMIFCDYNIHTGFTGMDALRIIRAYEAAHQPTPPDLILPVPVIMISSILNENAVVAAMNAGATDFIIKGYLERLISVIRREIRYTSMIKDYHAKWRDAEARATKI
ncbi:MAG: response regulator [Candidatus Kapaibacterium sp.]|nr:MAG: response regulator [Candidatus Kapabacteria bacterium]